MLIDAKLCEFILITNDQEIAIKPKLVVFLFCLRLVRVELSWPLCP